mgnify:CR=1 FL=1
MVVEPERAHRVEQVGHFAKEQISLAVNGATKQNATLSHMIWSVAEQIARLQRRHERIVLLQEHKVRRLNTPVGNVRTDAEPGATNQGVRVVSRRRAKDVLTLTFDGQVGRSYRIPGLSSGIRSLDGATLDGNDLLVTFPGGVHGEFVRRSVVLRLAQ